MSDPETDDVVVDTSSKAGTAPAFEFDRIMGLNKRPCTSLSTSAFSDRAPQRKPRHFIPLRFLKSIPIPIPNLGNGNAGATRVGLKGSKLAH
jgi:hypothetical protein